MDSLNTAIKTHFPDNYTVDISGGFFATLTFGGISPEYETTFVQSAKDAGVGIAPAWNAIAPNFRDEKRQNGLFVRLTFPAFQPDAIQWGISKLKELHDSFA